MAAEVLWKKGKRGAAVYLQTICNTSTIHKVLNELLDILLDPTKSIDDWDTIDWCRWLVAGGKTPDDYAQTVRRYDNASTCGLVWTANFVAYRCRTCGISPCMSLCADCFQRGNHEGHDFNMFRSQAGGACDCGDTSVMKESGFCHKHGPKAQMDKPVAPPDLLHVADAMMPRIILRLIQHLRDHSKPGRETGDVSWTGDTKISDLDYADDLALLANDVDEMNSFIRAVDDSANLDKYLTAIQEADGFLTMVHQYSEMGAAMREVMTEALTNPQLYSNLAVNCDHPHPDRAAYLKRNLQSYEEAKLSLSFPYGVLTCCNDLKPLNRVLEHSTFLEELVFWTIRFEFPQKLVCLLLNMLPDLNYKEAFTKTFVHHYSRISKMLAKSTDSDTLSNRVVHVSVQLFSNEDLAFRMTKDFSLLHVMVLSLSETMTCIALQSTLQCADKNIHLVVDCSHRILKEHCYWPLVSDLNNVLTHRPVAMEFLNDTKLLNMWFSFLSMFQGMNVNQRELKQHVEFESNTYYAAFSAELEASATPMWALISHLKDSNTLDQTKQVLRECLLALNRWFEAIGFSLVDKINPYQVSFHLPLHRYFAAFLCQAVRNQEAKLPDIVPTQEKLQSMMMHPLQAQVAFQEILSGMWVRNGLQIKGQAMTYIQCHFCNSMVDADLFLLQLCATHLDPDWFLKTILQRFHVWKWLTFHPDRRSTFLESDQILPMLEGALTFITTLMATHTNIGQTEEEVTRQEMVSLLCMSDRTHSQLMDLLPEKSGATSQNKDFESILTKVADYKAPNFEAGGTMLQGMYVPKPKIWEEEYDPIHILLRAVHRRDYQASLDRYTQYLRQSGKFGASGSPWPPFRIPGSVHKEFLDPRRILHSKTMHGIIFTILYRACNDPDVPEQILALCIYLLDMAIRFPVTITDSLVHYFSQNIFTNPTNTPDLLQLQYLQLQLIWLGPLELLLYKEPFTPLKDEVTDLNYNEWYPTGETLKNVIVPVKKIIITEKVEMSMGMVEEMEVDEEEEEMELEAECTTYHVQSPIIEEDSRDPINQHQSLPQTNAPLALPPTTSSSNSTDLVPIDSGGGGLMVSQLYTLATTSTPVGALPSTSGAALPGLDSSPSPTLVSNTQGLPTTLPHPLSTLPLTPNNNNGENMAIVPTSVGLTAIRPRCLKLKQVPGRHSLLLTNQGLPHLAGGESLKALPFSGKRVMEVNDSILSLLFMLHSKLCGKPDSYKLLSERSVSSDTEDSRIGDGTFFIERVIDRITQYAPETEKAIKEIKQKLWPKQEDDVFAKSSESLDKEERRRRAKERQQKLMAEFASRQKAFMQKTMETDQKEPPTANLDKESILNMTKEYECVICGQTTPSTDERPVGMVVLLQATSVLGHCHREPPSARWLPCTDEKRLQLKKEDTLASRMENRVEQLTRHFDNTSWQMAVNIGWEGGVHVQSCGHYLHVDCHKSYMQSLRSQNLQSQRHQNLAVDRGEYSCPLCRQLANSVLPLNPNIGEMAAIVCCRTNNLQTLASELSQLMMTTITATNPFKSGHKPMYLHHQRKNTVSKSAEVAFQIWQWTVDRSKQHLEKIGSNLHDKFSSVWSGLFVNSMQSNPTDFSEAQKESSILKSLSGIMEDLTNSTYPQYRSVCSPNSSSLFLFVCSIARTNLEVELVQRGGTLCSTPKKKSCFVPLLHALAMHARILIQTPANQLWSQLSGQPTEENLSSIAIMENEVPLLLRDCVALLLQIILTLPLNIDKAYYSCVVQVLYNLAYVQAIAQLSCSLNQSQRALWKQVSIESKDYKNDVIVVLGQVIDHLEHSSLYVDDEDMEAAVRTMQWTVKSLEYYVQSLCLPFLRIAALLQCHLYGEESLNIKDAHEEFGNLCKYLGLASTSLSISNITSAASLHWAIEDSSVLVKTWCQDYINFVNKSVIASRNLLERLLLWYSPALLQLPRNYDQIFQYYHRRPCSVCHSVPKDPSLCLVCGTMVCLRENCCRQQSKYEAVIHSISCGAGTAMFLAVNSSTIIVIRGKRACLWGSVYLDSFGEEDRDLKRGKPLYLSDDRYNLLQHQWLNHCFDHTNKRWVWHKDNL